MKPLDMFKAALAVLGIAVWGYGIRMEDRRVQGAGLAFVVLAFALRFVARRRDPL